jgi:hypothetical protein
LTGFRNEKFEPPSPNNPNLPYPKHSPKGNGTPEMCMNELEKCMNFGKNLDLTLLTSIGGFQGPIETIVPQGKKNDPVGQWIYDPWNLKK